MSKLFDNIMEASSEALEYMRGNDAGVQVHIPAQVDVRRIRGKLHMSQQRFAQAFGFSVDAVRHWESGRRCPESAARALLMVIDLDAKTVQTALSRTLANEPADAKSTPRKVTRAKRISAAEKRVSRTLVRTAA